MEIVDELMTPGCPNCAVKHLSAALATMVAARIPELDPDVLPDFGPDVSVARAIVNLVEAYEGYTSHFDYAIGLLVKAEEGAVARDARGLASEIRAARVKLMVDGAKRIPEAVTQLSTVTSWQAGAYGHFLEALRELPELSPFLGRPTVDDIRGMIATVVAEYFTVDEPEKKGGE